MITDLQLIRAHAEFIKQTLISSGKAEFDQHETVARDVSSLIDDVNSFASSYQLPVAMDIMFIKLIGTKTYEKEDLVYRVDQVLAVAGSILGKQKRGSLNKKGGSKMRAIQRRDENLPVMQNAGSFISKSIDRHFDSIEPKRETNFLSNIFSRRVTNTFIRIKLYENCTFHISGREEDD